MHIQVVTSGLPFHYQQRLFKAIYNDKYTVTNLINNPINKLRATNRNNNLINN